ncbi:hypothetical protein VP01_426g4 [Puccinia sorghi]|uniref:Uncharacterized protein n=1 Tax=Puccinia sorghi TaxID=27349 RepID=A0A0L6USA1_9BASI|nr:hypothetical protein VP01_426g4 [Puccinia sorghi]
METMRKHFVKHHWGEGQDIENGSWRDQTQQGWVETLLHHNHRRFFHVLPEQPSHELQSGPGKQPSHEEPIQIVSGTTLFNNSSLPPPERVKEIFSQLPQPPQFNQPNRREAGFRDTPY